MDVFEVLLKSIDEDRQATVASVVSGASVDFPEYKRLCGVLRGLDIAESHIRSLAERVKQDDD